MEDLVFKVVVLGMLVWALRGYIMARTKQRRATDQPLTLGELEGHCGREHEKIEQDLKSEVGHLKELVEKDLKHGREKFTKMEKRLDNHGTLLGDINTNVRLLAQKNGIKIEG